MKFQPCPLHSFEDVAGQLLVDGSWAYTCPLTSGHPSPGPFRWLELAEPPDVAPGLSGIAADLGLAHELPAVLKQFRGKWVEFGLVERGYALAKPRDFAKLHASYGHTETGSKKHYTVSAFLASTLGHLSRAGTVAYHPGPATGRWAYNSQISWWALHPEPEWEHRLSWQGSGFDMSYLPGATTSSAST